MNKILQSRTNWTIIVMFLIGGITAINQFIPPALLPYIEGGLGLLAMYFRVNTRVDFSKEKIEE